MLQLVVLILLLAIAILLGAPLIHGAPYVPTTKNKVGEIINLADIGPGDKLLDLGSGDGRIVIAAARKGVQAEGFELNPILVWISRRRIKKVGLSGKAEIHFKSFWKADFSKYDVVTLFGIEKIMKPLEQKLLSELKPEGKAASFVYQFPNWKPVKSENSIYLYKK